MPTAFLSHGVIREHQRAREKKGVPPAFMSHGVILKHQRARTKKGVPTAFMSHGVILKHQWAREKEGAKGQKNDFFRTNIKKKVASGVLFSTKKSKFADGNTL